MKRALLATGCYGYAGRMVDQVPHVQPALMFPIRAAAWGQLQFASPGHQWGDQQEVRDAQKDNREQSPHGLILLGRLASRIPRKKFREANQPLSALIFIQQHAHRQSLGRRSKRFRPEECPIERRPCL